jgi:hypothetical protein
MFKLLVRNVSLKILYPKHFLLENSKNYPVLKIELLGLADYPVAGLGSAFLGQFLRPQLIFLLTGSAPLAPCVQHYSDFFFFRI